VTLTRIRSTTVEGRERRVVAVEDEALRVQAQPLPDEIRRLTFARFIFELGVDQMRLPEPTCSAALLAFDDAAELVLHLAALRLGAKTNVQMRFMEHFAAIDGTLQPGQRTPLRVQMEALHDARNALKHKGRFPSRVDLEAYRGTGERFLDELTQMAFGVDFFGLSLADLVELQEARERLEHAATALRAGELAAAIEHSAVALAAILYDAKWSRKSKQGESLYKFGGPMDRVSSLLRLGQTRADPTGIRDAIGGHDLRRPIVVGKESTLTDWEREAFGLLLRGVSEIQEVLLLIVIGIDLRAYVDFKALAPAVDGWPGRRIVTWTDGARAAAREEDARRCVDFVIETALKLQERVSR
jgi:hypothetical protein